MKYKKNSWQNIKKRKNKDGLTIGQQREKIRKQKEDENKTKLKNIEDRIKEKAETKFYCDKIFVKGIYFLYLNGKIVYIGLSTGNVLERVVAHQKDHTKVFDSFSIKDFSFLNDDELMKKEKYLISKFCPKYNIVHNPKNKAPKKPVIIYGRSRAN